MEAACPSSISLRAARGANCEPAGTGSSSCATTSSARLLLRESPRGADGTSSEEDRAGNRRLKVHARGQLRLGELPARSSRVVSNNVSMFVRVCEQPQSRTSASAATAAFRRGNVPPAHRRRPRRFHHGAAELKRTIVRRRESGDEHLSEVDLPKIRNHYHVSMNFRFGVLGAVPFDLLNDGHLPCHSQREAGHRWPCYPPAGTWPRDGLQSRHVLREFVERVVLAVEILGKA